MWRAWAMKLQALPIFPIITNVNTMLKLTRLTGFPSRPRPRRLRIPICDDILLELWCPRPLTYVSKQIDVGVNLHTALSSPLRSLAWEHLPGQWVPAP